MYQPGLRRRMWEFGKLLGLAVDPRTDAAARIYDILSTHNNLAEQSLYLNLGYWEEARTYDEACEALAARLGVFAGLAQGDEVLDAGCGFGDQDRFYLDRFSPKNIVGLNVTSSQLTTAARRHRLPGLAWVHGSATRLPFDDAAFDKVIALESAFHFATRLEFFGEALRVLKPNGWIALADVVITGEKRSFMERLTDAAGHRMWQVPGQNLYGIEEYCEIMKRLGYSDIEYEDVSAHVFEPFDRFARERVKDPEVKARLNPLLRLAWTAPGAITGTRYVLVRARKPERSVVAS